MYFNLKSLYLRCLCYLFSAKTAWQLVNRKADFFIKRIDSHNESNRIDLNRELECSIQHSPTASLLAVDCVLGARQSAAVHEFECNKQATS